MNILITQMVSLTDETFQQEVAARRQRLQLTVGQNVTGCPLCTFDEHPVPRAPVPPGQQ